MTKLLATIRISGNAPEKHFIILFLYLHVTMLPDICALLGYYAELVDYQNKL